MYIYINVKKSSKQNKISVSSIFFCFLFIYNNRGQRNIDNKNKITI